MLKNLKVFYCFIRDIFASKELILQLAKNDFKVKYAGSFLGVLWAFIQPLITILVFWFVFQVGFRTAPVNGLPYILWMICGVVPWYFFSDAVNFSTTCMVEYSYLVKKVVFRVSVLPIVKIMSALFVHIFFVCFIFLMFIIYGYRLNIIYIQVIYYMFATFVLVVGISWITSSLMVFIKDTSQIITVFLQFGFWLTPIFWTIDKIPTKYQFLLKLNPMYYVVSGYRDTFINHVWFWERYNQTLYFWVITSFIFVFGALFFNRLKPHFSDIL